MNQAAAIKVDTPDPAAEKDYHDDTYTCPGCNRKVRGTSGLPCTSCSNESSEDARRAN